MSSKMLGLSKLFFCVVFVWQIELREASNLNHCNKRYKLQSAYANFTIGRLFPVHIIRASEGKNYEEFNSYGLAWTEAMVFAIDGLNNSSFFRSNYSIGFDIRDSCNDVNLALQDSLDFILEAGENSTSVKGCNCKSKTSSISAVIGGAASPISTKIAHIFGVANIPEISYSSTSVLLSKNDMYPSFFRTIPSDIYQAQSIADLLVEFKWSYVSVVASDSEYGRAGMDALKIELKKRNICMAVERLFHPNLYTKELTGIISLLKTQVRAKVIVLWCQRPNAIGFLEHATRLSLKGKTWIGTETWGDSYHLYKLSAEIVGGMIGIVPQLKTHPEFENHLDRLDPGNSRRNPWFEEFWEKEFDCQTLKNYSFKNSTSSPGINHGGQLFTRDNFYFFKSNTDDGAIIVCPKNKGQPSANDLPRTKCTNVMDAVYAVAHALQLILNCTAGLRKCPPTDPVINPKDLLRYIQNVSFIGRSGKKISFDENGDLEYGSYAIKILQPETTYSSKMKFLEIGSWDGADGTWKFIDGIQYLWNGWVKEMPSSNCNDLCFPGEYAVNGSNKCCWTCVKCPKGYVKESRGLEPCTRCPDGYESNSNRSVCIERVYVYMDWKSGQAICVSIASLFNGFFGSFVLLVFIRNRQSPVVKASNRELSFLHLSVLIVTFMYPFALIGKPTTVRCGLRPFLFSILFTTSTSITLLKTDRLLRIFRSRSRLSSQSRLLTNKMQLMLAAALTSLPLVGVSMWFLIQPPEISVTEDSENEHYSIIRCDDNTDTLQMIILSYVLLLALVCTYFAYRARELPENFNEAKFIGFAMFSFCLSWVSFVPAFYSSTGINRTFVYCLAVLSSTMFVTTITYFPKIRLILFYPEQNRTEVFRINASTMNIKTRANSASSLSARLSPIPSPIESHKQFGNDSTLRASLGNRRLSAISVGRGVVFTS